MLNDLSIPKQHTRTPKINETQNSVKRYVPFFFYFLNLIVAINNSFYFKTLYFENFFDTTYVKI